MLPGCQYKTMFVIGFISDISSDGQSAIATARGSSALHILFYKKDVYCHGYQLHPGRSLNYKFKLGDTLKLIIVEMYPRQIKSLTCCFEARLAWIGCTPRIDWLNPKYSFFPDDVTTQVYYMINFPSEAVTEVSGSVKINKTYVFVKFSADVIFMNKMKVADNENLVNLSAEMGFCTALVVMEQASSPFFGVFPEYRAVLMWYGQKPSLNITYKSNDLKACVSDNKSEIVKLNDKAVTSKFLVSTFSGVLYAADIKVGVIGYHDNCVEFDKCNFYVNGELADQNLPLMNAFNVIGQQATLQAIIIEVNIAQVLGWFVQWKALYVWVGPEPDAIKESSKNFLIVPLRVRSLSKDASARHGTFGETKNNHIQLSDNLRPATKESKDFSVTSTLSRQGRLSFNQVISGYVLAADSNEAILTSFWDIVVFARRKFYVNGVKFNKNKSLLDYIKGKETMISCYVVPIEKPRLIHNCIVYSRALCAWIGEEPKELVGIKNDYIKSGSPMKFSVTSELSGFHYFIGRISSIVECTGVILCERSDLSVHISFRLDCVYVKGMKLSEISLKSYFKLLMSSMWSVLAKPCSKIIDGKNATYEAVCVWHFKDQVSLFSELTTKLPLWFKKAFAEGCDCENNLKSLKLTKPGIHFYGKIVYRDKMAVMVEVSHHEKGVFNVGVFCKDLWVDSCQCSLTKTDDGRICHLYVTENENIDVMYGLTVHYVASLAWIGELLIKLDFCEEMEPLSAFDKMMINDNETNKGVCINGSVKLITDDYGIVEADVNGTVYALFKWKNFYVNGLTFNCHSDNHDVLVQKCHFYAVPVEAKLVNGFLISIEATLVWVGEEPVLVSHLNEKISSSTKAKNFANNLDCITENCGIAANDKNIVSLDPVHGEIKQNTMQNHELSNSQKYAKCNALKGKICDIFKGLGRLKDENGEVYFFESKETFLYGVALSEVELWHIFLCNMEVEYSLNSDGYCSVWIGSKEVECREVSAACIYKFCKDNYVPEKTKAVLISKLNGSLV